MKEDKVVTIRYRSEQKVFDKIYDHLVKQGKQSRTSNQSYDHFTCKYEGPDATQCAIGCVVSKLEDRLYLDSREETGIENLQHMGLVKTSLDITLLVSLQEVHDKTDNWSKEGFIGHSDMKRVAQVYGLNFRSRA